MAHDITDQDNLFTVHRPAWHGLGQVLTDYPTRAEAQAIAHPWNPISEPVYRRVLGVDPLTEEPFEAFEEIEGSKLNVRSDTGYALGVTTDTFEPVTNDEMYDIAEAVEGGAAGSVRYETGGSLKGGSKVWLLLRLKDPLVVPGDPAGATVPYYALQNAHDGSGAFRGQATMTRVVCNNTAHAADLDARARGTEFVFRHTRNVKDRIEQAKQALAGWRESIEGWKIVSEDLINQSVGPQARVLFIEQFIPAPPPHMASERVMENVHNARGQLKNILDSVTCDGISHTAYGLVQAVTEYENHFRVARSKETRFKRTYLDRSTIIADAVKLAREVATV